MVPVIFGSRDHRYLGRVNVILQVPRDKLITLTIVFSIVRVMSLSRGTCIFEDLIISSGVGLQWAQIRTQTNYKSWKINQQIKLKQLTKVTKVTEVMNEKTKNKQTQIKNLRSLIKVQSCSLCLPWTIFHSSLFYCQWTCAVSPLPGC